MSARLFIGWQWSSAQLLSCVFILGMWYLSLGVLRHAFRYAVSILIRFEFNSGCSHKDKELMKASSARKQLRSLSAKFPAFGAGTLVSQDW